SWQTGGPLAAEITTHPERRLDVLFSSDPHLGERYRLHRLFRRLPEHIRGPEPYLRAPRRRGGPRRVSFGGEHVVQWSHQIGVGPGIHHHGMHHSTISAIHPHDG